MVIFNHLKEASHVHLRVGRELLTNRHLIANLVRRDLKIRYKGSFLGFLWALLNPLGTMLIFLFIFSHIPKMKVDNYSFFMITAILPWGFFSSSLIKCASIMLDQAPMVKKIYFPREILPLSAVLADFINLILGLALVIIAWGLFHPDSLTFLWFLPFILFFHLFFTLGLAYFLAAANVFMRDTAQIFYILITFWYFLTPIFYSLDILPAHYHYLYLLNPMASIVGLYRVAVLSRIEYFYFCSTVTVVSSVLFMFFGLYFFKRLENRFVKLL